MRFHSLRVENFRRLIEPVEIADIDSELTVIAGGNEEGKSTLLEAVRTALFDRYKLSGMEAERLQPLGYKVAPQVDLTFSINGQRYELSKRFCQKPSAKLTTPQGVLQDDAAEQKLEELVGFTRPGRGASKPEHQGVWGLLWVEQGRMFQGVSAGADAQGRLHRALEAEVGDVLGGAEGQALLERLEAARKQYWTASTGKPSGKYKEAGIAVAQAREHEAELVEQLHAYDAKVDELGRIENKLGEHHDSDTLGERRRALEARQSEHEGVKALQREVENAESELKLAEAQAENETNRWEQRQAIRQRLERQTDQVRRLAESLEAEKAAHEQSRTALNQARTTLDDADKKYRDALRRAARLQEAERRLADQTRLAELRNTLRQARAAQKTFNQARADAAAIVVNDSVRDELTALASKISQLEGRLQAGATVVGLQVNVPVSPSGEYREYDEGYLVTGTAKFALEGVGEVSVVAGGQDLTDVERELDRRRQSLAEDLERVGAESVNNAVSLARQRESHEREATAQKKLIEHYAPEGVEALTEEVERLQAALESFEAPSDLPGDKDALSRLRAEAEKNQEACANALEKARADQERARDTDSTARDRLTQVRTEHKGAEDERQRVEVQLVQERASVSDDALYNKKAEAEASLQGAQNKLARKRSELDAADPEMVEIRLKRAAKALEEAQKDIDQLAHQASTLRAELQALGQQGLGEKLESVKAELTDAERRYQRLHREANAVRVAYEAVANAAAEARQTFLQPITERVSVYLRSLLPDAQLELDDQLQVQGLRRSGQSEPFDALSVGTREQLAVITRFAFADLLAEQGQAVPIFLDDALVYADDERFHRMLDVLARAAERHQVIVLTCHESAYRGLGGHLVRLKTPEIPRD